jgi:phage terminase small subunit
MKQPGRVSAEAASVVVPPEATLPNAGLPPPPQLGAREAAEWQAITTGLGAAWFPRECHALLAAYCVTKTQLDDVHQALAAFGSSIPEDRPGWQRYRELTRLRGELIARFTSLATKLRLTPQTRVHRYVAGTQAQRRAGRPPPWAAMHDDDPCAGSS